MMSVLHYPKGEMCMTCKDLHINCSGKPFSKMPKMGKAVGFEVVVRCVDFKYQKLDNVVKGE